MLKKIDKIPLGGWGIKIFSHVADELSYRRTLKQQNGLPAVKKYEQQGLAHLQDIRDTPLQKIFLQVNTELSAVDQDLNWYEPLEKLPFPKTVLWQCKLALVEGFTNAVRHAHKGLSLETPIELEVTVFKERLEIRIWDYGQAFDLKAKLSELSEINQDPLEREGGRGLEFMQKLADQLSYTRTYDKRNCLLLVKQLTANS